MGTYGVRGHFAGVSAAKTFSATTTLSPWGLIVLIVVLVIALVAATAREIAYSVRQHRKKQQLQWYDKRLAVAGGVSGAMAANVVPGGTGTPPSAWSTPGAGVPGPPTVAPGPAPAPGPAVPGGTAPAAAPVAPRGPAAPVAPRPVPGAATPITPPSGPAAPRAVPDGLPPSGGSPGAAGA